MASASDNTISREQIAATHFDQVPHAVTENDGLLLIR